MAQDSKRKRREQKMRAKLTGAKHVHKRLIADYQRTYLTLLYVLAQKGGSITITHGTMLEVMKQAATLRWQAMDGENPGEVVVRILEQTETIVEDAPQTDVPADVEPLVTIRRVPDEDDHEYAVESMKPVDHIHDPTHPDIEEARMAGEGGPHGD